MAYTTIDKPTDYFNTKLYTGNGSTNAITGVGFQPDWTWIKNRDGTDDHKVFDAVRGVTKVLKTNTTGAETTDSNTLSAFGTDGFTVGSDGGVNGNSDNFVSWNWLGANGTASNTDGSITSSVSASTDAGFSIVGWTGNNTNGATVGHGLGVTPDVVFFKNRSGPPNSWHVYHSSFANATDLLLLDGTNAIISSNNYISGTRPSSSLLTLGNSAATNENSETIISYCFAEKKGYSKFGSYTGNGNADGTFVYTGFKPAFVITKRTDGTVDWYMFDNKRQNSFNVVNGMLRPSATSVELDDSSVYVDFLSNGFKWKGNNAGNNTSGGTYIFMAFAEAPFVTAGTKAPGTAR